MHHAGAGAAGPSRGGYGKRALAGNGDALAAKRKMREANHGPGTVWTSKFGQKSRAEQRRLIQEPWHFPMAAQNLAAIEVQKVVRGHIGRLEVTRRRAAVVPGREGRAGDEEGKKRDAEAPLRRRSLSRKPLSGVAPSADLLNKYLRSDSARRIAETSGADPLEAYADWALARVQGWWRMLMVQQEYERNRHSMYHIAAMQIQYLWRAHQRHRYIELSGPQPQIDAANVIQRAWRRWTNQRIYRYYRDLLRFRNTGDPAVMLRSINPREASLIDAASQIRVRFRLGGATFPPTIYYKMFTNASMCDVNAFAPRDYTEESAMVAAHRHNKPVAPPEGHGLDDSDIAYEAEAAGTGAVIRVGSKFFTARLSRAESAATTGAESATGGRFGGRRKKVGAHEALNLGASFGVGRAGPGGRLTAASVSTYGEGGEAEESKKASWYRRVENNGWRPVSLKSLEDADKDPVTRATAALAAEFHYSKLKRKGDIKVRRKERKREWLSKMYRDGLAKERGVAAGSGKHDTIDELIDFDDPEWERDAAELLEWSSTLDFDAYLDDWTAVGTSGRPWGMPGEHDDAAGLEDELAGAGYDY